MSRLTTSNLVRTLQRFTPGIPVDAGATILGSIPVGLVETGHALKAASGRFACGGIQLVTSAVVPVVDLPTTTAPICVYNNDADGGRCLVIEDIAVAFASGTAGAGGFSIFCGVTSAVVVTPPTANGTNFKVQKTRGYGSSVAYMLAAQTIPAGTAWVLLDGLLTTAVTVLGVGKGIKLEGCFVVPPRYAFCFGVLSDLGTTAKFLASARWGEYEMELPTV